MYNIAENISESNKSEKLINLHKKITRAKNNKYARTGAVEPEGGEQANVSGAIPLTNSHIRPQFCNSKLLEHIYVKHRNRKDGKMTIYSKGQFIKVKTPWIGPGIRNKTGKRGIISNMSSKSRSRLMARFAMLDKSKQPLFVGLTYPEKYPSMKESKRHFKVFFQRMKREYPEIGYIWRIELQKRGAPHYHIFLWGCGDMKRDFVKIYKFILTNWADVVDSDDIQHLIHGAEVETIRTPNGAMAYASKYMAKKDNTEINETGRCWGYGGKVPWAEGQDIPLTFKQAHHIERLLRRRIKRNNKGLRSFIITDPEFWLLNIDRILKLKDDE